MLLGQAMALSRREFEIVGKRDMEQALEESLRLIQEKNELNYDEAVKKSLDTFYEQE